MPLPSFTLAEDVTLYDILGDVSGGELSPAVLTQAEVKFKPNIPDDRFIAWENNLYRVPPVTAKVTAEGILRADGGGPVTLLANDPGLSVEDLQWLVEVRIPDLKEDNGRYSGVTRMRSMRKWAFNAPLDGAVVNLATTMPVTFVDAVGITKGDQGYSFAGFEPALGDTAVQGLREGPSGTVPVGDPIVLPSAAWGSIAGKPTVIAAGADAEAARDAIGAIDARSMVLIPLSDYLDPGQELPNDGVTDAAPLINEALNDLLAKANGPQPFGPICYVLDLGPGRFRTNSNINPGGTTPTGPAAHIGIRGAGRDQTFILPNGATSGVVFYAVPDPEDPVAIDCHFYDFTIDLDNATLGPSGESRKGFIGRGFFDCTWSRVTVRNSPATAFGTDFPVRCMFTDCAAITTGPGGVNGELDMSDGVLAAAKYWSGFGIGFGVFDDESVIFDNCWATDCYRGGFFFEAFEASGGHTNRNALIQMNGCRSWNNRIGITNVGSGSLVATNCRITDNTVTGYYGGVSGVSQEFASINTTLDNCQLLRNGYGLYSTGDYTTADHRGYSALIDVLGGYRILNCRIEDNTGGGIVAEQFGSIEAGGLTIRGNHFRRNGVGILMREAVGPLRDVVIEDNYFDANDDTAMRLLVAMNAPKITGNTFVNATGTEQTVGVEFHPAEPVTAPLVDANTFRQITTPMLNAEHLNLTETGDRILDALTDPDDPWIYREQFFGGTSTAWPVSGDGWAKSSTGSTADWLRTSVGIAKGGSGTSISYIYRDLGTSGAYVEGRITKALPTDAANTSQFMGVMHSLASASTRTALVFGVNTAGAGNTLTSNFYALWRVVGGTWTLLWESSVPYTEGHAVAIGRLAGSTVTDLFIDGELVHTIDVPAVAPTGLAGVSSVIVSAYARYIADFRAMPYTHTAPPPTGDALTLSSFAASAVTTESEKIVSNDNDTSLPTSAAVLDLVQKLLADRCPSAYVSGTYYFCNSPNANATSNTLGADRARTTAWLVTTPTPISAFTAEYTVAGDAGSVFRICVWNDDGYGRPGTLLVDAGTISTGGTPGEYEVAASLTVQPGLYHVGGIIQGVTTTQPTMRIVDYRACPHTGPVATGLAANKVGGGYYKDGFTGAATDITSPLKNQGQSTVAPRIGFKVA